ncbi:hypothetical protein ACFQS1_16315 [Paractinoplanes rhizophilus]|uniref:Uncharacterized protein n=1 Tax=Paractinoplanes rhizophilus TaxID=1416877 RepID=A0ABW2HRP6_9ACTN
MVQTHTVWWVRDDGGSPTPLSSSGRPAFPYWSSEARAQRAANLWGLNFVLFRCPWIIGEVRRCRTC